MEQTFDAILTSILEAYENDPEQNIDALIEEKCKEWNLSDEQMTLLKETNGLIDSFTEYSSSLEMAKAEGRSRKNWMLNKLDQITAGHSEEEKTQIISAISDTNEKIIEETMSKE